jgi:Protein of unknown function (DUF1236)
MERPMQKFGMAAIAAISLALPQVALAQSSPQDDSMSSIKAQVKSNLEQAGFSNIRVMPEAFLVRATDRNGKTVMMVVNPDSVTQLTGTPPNGGNASSPEHQGQTISKSAKMTGNPANSGAMEQNEANQTTSQSSEMNGMIAGSDDNGQTGLKLTNAQRAEIWNELGSQSPAGQTLKVGDAVPDTLQLQALPGDLSNHVPALQSYQYAMVNGQVLIVDPATKTVAAIITD